jgi:hypothetical protein
MWYNNARKTLPVDGSTTIVSNIFMYIKKSLIIHEENSKEMNV